MTATSFRIAKDSLGNDGSDHGFIIATKVAILKTATVVLGTSTSAAISTVQCTYFDGGRYCRTTFGGIFILGMPALVALRRQLEQTAVSECDIPSDLELSVREIYRNIVATFLEGP